MISLPINKNKRHNLRGKVRVMIIFVLCLALVSGAVPTQSSARSIEEISGDLSSLNNEVSRLDAEIAELEGQLDEKRSQIRSLNNDIEELSTEIDKLGLEIQNTQAKIKRTEAEIEKTEISIRTKERELQETKRLLVEYIRLINDADNVNAFEILLSGKSFSEILNQFEYTETLQKKTQESLERIKQIKQDLEQQQATLQQQRVEAIELQTQLEGQRDALSATRSEKDRLLALSEDEAKNYESLIVKNEALQKEVLQDIESLEKELSAQTGGGGIPAGAPPAGSGVLSLPSNGIEVQGYGMTDFAEGGAYGGSGHNGIDIASGMGSPVYASADGVVSQVGDLGGVAYGRWISVRHHDLGFDTLYGHLLASKVSVGDSVTKGQIIGLMGSTGYSTGPHVHFMVCFDLRTQQQGYGLLPYCNHVNPHLYL